ncbi:MAG: hypothetical protein ACK42G_04380 [Candidatus Kapaibacteriota bacterium]|jgi:hypothetical protein
MGLVYYLNVGDVYELYIGFTSFTPDDFDNSYLFNIIFLNFSSFIPELMERMES